MKNDIIIYKGKWIKKSQLRIDPLKNRSFLYGDAFFDTMRVIDGKVVFKKDHFKRLKNGLKTLCIDLELKKVKTALAKLMALNALQSASVKIHIWRNAKGKYTPEENKGAFLIMFERIKSEGYVLNKKGVHLGVYNKSIHKDSFFRVKSLRYQHHILAGIWAKQNDFDNAILRSSSKKISECINGNIIAVKKNALITPKPNQTFLKGIARDNILKLALKHNYKVIEKSIYVQDLEDFDELFITNVVQGIRWVKKCLDKTYSNQTSSLLIAHLNAQLHKNIKS